MYKILFLFCLLLPFQVALSPFSGVDLASVRLFIPLLFLLSFGLGLLRRKIIFSGGVVGIGLMLFLTLGALSFFQAIEINWAIRKWLFFISIFPLFFLSALTINSYQKVIGLARALVASGFLVSLIAIAQFSAQWLWGWDAVYNWWAKIIVPPFLGASLGGMVLAYPSWLVNLGGQTVLRATAIFPDPHMLSLFLGLVMPISFGLALNSQKRIFYFIAGSLMIIADGLTFSRGGYLGLVAGIMGVIIFYLVNSSAKKRWLIIFSVIAILLLSLSMAPIRSRIYSSFDLKEGSNSGRLVMWQKATEATLQSPVLGVGLGNFPVFVKPSTNYREPIYAHNTYLDIAAEMGVINALVWCFILVWTIKRFLNLAKKQLFFLFPAVSILVFASHSMVETGLYSPVVLSTLLIILSWSYYEKA